MVSKIIGVAILIACLAVSILRAAGIMEGDFILPLILLSQLFILGYIVNITQLLAKDIILRYNRRGTGNTGTTTLHTWN